MLKPVTMPVALAPADASDVARLGGRRRMVARVTWFVVAALALALLLASLPEYFLLVGIVTEQERAASVLLGSAQIFSPSPEFEFWADLFYNAISVFASVLCLALAALIFRRRSDETMAFVVSLTLLIFGVVMTGPSEMLVGQRIEGEAIALFGQMLLWAFVLFLFYIFPDGRFVPKWTRWLSVLLIPWALGLALYQPYNMNSASILPFMILYTLPSLTAPLAQIYRHRRVSSVVQRQQTKWVVLGFSAWILAGTGVTGVLIYLASQFVTGANSTPTLESSLVVFAGRLLWPVSLLFVPLSLTLAILRYRLFDINLILNRALAYGLLTAFVIAAYVLVVGAFGAIFQTNGNLVISLLATAGVAALFQPLRERVQRAVNRLTYGERDEPYTVLARLGQRLEATLAPDAVLPTIAETVAQALKLPYVAVELTNDERRTMGAQFPSSVIRSKTPLIRLPLLYQHESIGELVVALRPGDETFSSADRALLETIADQTAIAAHTVRLTSALQHSRERLVTAREEERRRIRRDLHDGLGPALASMTLQLDAALNSLREDPQTTSELLLNLKVQSRDALDDIRLLVYALRPPALDELGLLGALREQTTHYESPDGLRIRLDAPDQLPPLAAAVEVAAYRIVTEALANVVKHAHAKQCDVAIACTPGEMQIEVFDDGDGIPPEARAGVGLNSMRERASELGGSCAIESNQGRGTRVRARLPIVIDA